MRSALILGLALCFFCAGTLPAAAHRVNIFAYVDNGDVVVECGFNRSRKVRQGQIEVFDAVTGAPLLQGTTDDQGQFRFPVPASAARDGHGLRIRINAGEGHQNDWTVEANEFAASPPPTQSAASPAPSSQTARTSSPVPVAGISGNSQAAATPADVERIVNAALDSRLAPIKHMLTEQFEVGPNLRDIIGGIGWIFGLIGVAAYFRRRR